MAAAGGFVECMSSSARPAFIAAVMAVLIGIGVGGLEVVGGAVVVSSALVVVVVAVVVVVVVLSVVLVMAEQLFAGAASILVVSHNTFNAKTTSKQLSPTFI